MVKYKVNTNKHTVIIPTAGLGSRLGAITHNLNKGLIPFKNKPIISHIIERFPVDTTFIIPVGYLSDQVKDFLKLVYPDHDFIFVEIDDYTSNHSGPGYTISKCLNLINSSFWYIPCDTYFTEDITVHNLIEDTCFVKQVSPELSNQYTMFHIQNNRIINMTFKTSQSNDWVALTGVMYIHDYHRFKECVKNLSSPEIIWAINIGTSIKYLDTWLDFGNLEIYTNEFKKSQRYDFSKTDEITYICNDRVAKWWLDPHITEKKYRKWLSNPEVLPKNCKYSGNWLVYDYFLGTVVYNNYSIEILDKMLLWLSEFVWRKKDVDITKSTLAFYKSKTISRVNKFLEKYPNLENVTHVNHIPVKGWEYYFKNIDWDLLINTNLPGFIHGDLHFDNVIIDHESKKFTCIDWRHEFGNLIELGDIYYDLAKLMGGFVIDYSKIKQNDFMYEKNNTKVTLTIPRIENAELYIEYLKNFIIHNGWDFSKVKLLIPIIFWNMSPLHTTPFDKFLWYLGIMLFEEYLNDY